MSEVLEQVLTEGRLPWRIKALFAVAGTAGVLRLTPPVEAVPSQPLARRKGGVPPSWIAGRPPTGVERRDTSAATSNGAVPLRIYRPAGDSRRLPVLVYLHGGGWVSGSLDTTDVLCSTLAVRAGTAVVSVDYRLAPESPYPAALDDAEAVVRWLRSGAGGDALDAAALSVAGDSAGGGLAAALAIRLRDAGLPLRAQVLLYPALDATLSSPSMAGFRGWGLRSRDMRVYWDAYAGDADRRDPELSPAHVPDPTGLPPAYVLTAGLDCLRDEAQFYVRRLAAVSVPVRFTHFADLPHGFLNLAGLCREASTAIDGIAAFLRRTAVPDET